MFDSFVARIRRKSRGDYEEIVFTAITDLRIWVQEHAEKAALVFLGIGFLLPFLFKLVLFVAALVVLFCFVVWTVARPGTSAANAENGAAVDAPARYENPSADSKSDDGSSYNEAQ